MAWIKLGSTTLTTTADVINSGTFTASKFIFGMTHIFASGGNKAPDLRFDQTGGTAYATRYCPNGGADVATETSQPDIKGIGPTGDDDFVIYYAVNIGTEEKLVIMSQVNRNALGSGYFPYREETVGKYAQTSAQVTEVGIINTSTGDYTADSNFTAIGSNGTEELNVQDGAIYYDTDLNKEYVLYNNTWTEV